jgi:hypothetical protein
MGEKENGHAFSWEGAMKRPRVWASLTMGATSAAARVLDFVVGKGAGKVGLIDGVAGSTEPWQFVQFTEGWGGT